MIIKSIILGIFAFSAVVCHGIAKMKHKKPVFRGMMGLLFGPFAIACLLLSEPASAKETEPLNDRVKYYLELGLLDNEQNKTVEELTEEILRRYTDEWGDDIQRGDPDADLKLLKYGSSRVWWEDTEADVIEGNSAYISLLSELGEVSNNIFNPEIITEHWKSNNGPIEVSYTLNGVGYVINPDYLDDYLDMKVLLQVNKVINSEYKFELLEAFDQTAFVIFISEWEKDLLKKRGWKFTW